MSGEFPRAGFWRRFASLVYDTLAIIAFAMLTVVLYLFAVQGLISLDVITNFRHKKTLTNLVRVIKSGTSGRTVTDINATLSGARVPPNTNFRHKKTSAKTSRGCKKWYPQADCH